MDGNRALTWRKSSYSGNSGGQCVEIGNAARLVAVRDSKDPDGPVLAFAADTWAAFAERVKASA
jgi:Domain of unknown function (DUF397)